MKNKNKDKNPQAPTPISGDQKSELPKTAAYDPDQLDAAHLKIQNYSGELTRGPDKIYICLLRTRDNVFSSIIVATIGSSVGLVSECKLFRNGRFICYSQNSRI